MSTSRLSRVAEVAFSSDVCASEPRTLHTIVQTLAELARGEQFDFTFFSKIFLHPRIRKKKSPRLQARSCAHAANRAAH